MPLPLSLFRIRFFFSRFYFCFYCFISLSRLNHMQPVFSHGFHEDNSSGWMRFTLLACGTIWFVLRTLWSVYQKTAEQMHIYEMLAQSVSGVSMTFCHTQLQLRRTKEEKSRGTHTRIFANVSMGFGTRNKLTIYHELCVRKWLMGLIAVIGHPEV